MHSVKLYVNFFADPLVMAMVPGLQCKGERKSKQRVAIIRQTVKGASINRIKERKLFH